MNPVLGLSILVALGCAWLVSRRIARRRGLRRQKMKRARGAPAAPRSFAPAKTSRSQMRTDDDPTTAMERITETKPPAEIEKRKKA
jgi:hypothetical protein